METALAATRNKLKEREAEQARTLLRQQLATALREQTQQLLESPAAQGHSGQFELIESLRSRALGEHTLTVESCDQRAGDVRYWLQIQIDAEDKKLARLGEKIVRAMVEYKEAFKLDTQEVDASVAAGADYRTMLDKLNAAGFGRG